MDTVPNVETEGAEGKSEESLAKTEGNRNLNKCISLHKGGINYYKIVKNNISVPLNSEAE
jgi:hypothetical protein